MRARKNLAIGAKRTSRVFVPIERRTALRRVFATFLSSALGQGYGPALYWHGALSAAEIRCSGPVRHGYLSTGPLCLPELCGASACQVVVAVQGIKPGRKERLAPAKRSHCLVGRLSPHARRIHRDG